MKSKVVRRALAFAMLAASLGLTRSAGAQDAGTATDGPAADAFAADVTSTPYAPPQGAVLPPPSAGPGEKRPVPNYDGRAPPSGTTGEALAWAPRVLLFPAYAVTEYGVRRPLVAVGTFGEKHYLWQRVYHLLTWDDGRAGVYPIVDFEVALKSTGGAALFARDIAGSGHHLNASAAFADQGVLNLRVRDHVTLWPNHGGGVYVHATWVRRPDGVYFGGSGITRQSDLLYYAYDDRAAELGVDRKLGGMSGVSVELGLRDIAFGTDTRSEDRTGIATRLGGPAQPALPAGFDGYRLVRPRVRLVLDSRDPNFEHPTGTGVRFEADAAYGRASSDASAAFVGWGAKLAGFWDVSGVNHVLALEVLARFVEPLSGGPIPFTELPSLGGASVMRGFWVGRFRDGSVVAATLQYRYPIWAYVDGELFAGVGNAYPGHLQGLSSETLYLSYGGGLRSTFSREVSMVATLAAGTRRFDDPAFTAADSVHLVLSAVHGF